MTNKKFKDYSKELQLIYKDTLKNYEYKYYNKTSMGMELNEDANTYFGNNRAGYEYFKQENPDSTVDYANTSLRTVYDSVSKKITGYITEKTLSCTPQKDEARKIFNLQLQEVINYLDVKDEAAFMFYINAEMESSDFNTSVDYYKSKVSYLVDLIQEYNEDEEFRYFINKIKG